MAVYDEETGKSYIRDPETGGVVEFGTEKFWNIRAKQFSDLRKRMSKKICHSRVVDIKDQRTLSQLDETIDQITNPEKGES